MSNSIDLTWMPRRLQLRAAKLIVNTCAKLAQATSSERALDEQLAKLPTIARRQKQRAKQRRGR